MEVKFIFEKFEESGSPDHISIVIPFKLSSSIPTHFFFQLTLNLQLIIQILTVSQSSATSNAPPAGRRSDEPPPLPPSRISFHRQGSQSQATPSEDTEDTMKNLRKTFAGIFGEM